MIHPELNAEYNQETFFVVDFENDSKNIQINKKALTLEQSINISNTPENEKILQSIVTNPNSNQTSNTSNIRHSDLKIISNIIILIFNLYLIVKK